MAGLDITALTQEVTDTEGVEASSSLLIVEFAKEVARLAALPTVNPAELQALADRMKAAREALAAAIAANPDPNPND